VHFSGCWVAASAALFVYLSSYCQRTDEDGLRRILGPSLETGAVFDAALSVNYCAIAIACLRLPSHLFVMKKGPASIPNSAPIWQKRFYDFHVRTEQKQIEKLRYIHRNPG